MHPTRSFAPIGGGGMGQVYKAYGTQLDRMVAIKICAEQFSDRFERVARAVPSLNHPNMAVEVKAAASLEAGAPRALFETRGVAVGNNTNRYATMADGRRFLINTEGDEESASRPFPVVLNRKGGRP